MSRSTDTSVGTIEEVRRRLLKAAKEGDLDEVQSILDDDGVETNLSVLECTNKHKNTPLLVACYKGHLRLVDYLLQRGASIRAVNQKGWTALHCAVASSVLSIATRILDANAPTVINQQDDLGNTALHCACREGYTDMVELLVGIYHADTTICNHKQQTPLEVAEEEYETDIVEFLSTVNNLSSCTANHNQNSDAPQHVLGQQFQDDYHSETDFQEEKKGDWPVQEKTLRTITHVYPGFVSSVDTIDCSDEKKDSGDAKVRQQEQHLTESAISNDAWTTSSDERRLSSFDHNLAVSNHARNYPQVFLPSQQTDFNIERATSAALQEVEAAMAPNYPVAVTVATGLTDQMRHDRDLNQQLQNQDVGKIEHNIQDENDKTREAVKMVPQNIPLCSTDDASTSLSSKASTVTSNTATTLTSSKQQINNYFKEVEKSLLKATKQGDLSNVQQLLLQSYTNSNGVRISMEHALMCCQNRQGNTPLLVACYWGHPSIVAYLLQREQQQHVTSSLLLDATNYKGWTALHCAVLGSCTCNAATSANTGARFLLVAEMILQYQEQQEERRLGPFQPLSMGTTNTKSFLNRQDCDGNTALHHACREGCVEMVQLLTQKYNADINRLNKDQQTPLQLAEQEEERTVVDILLETRNAHMESAELLQVRFKDSNSTEEELERRLGKMQVENTIHKQPLSKDQEEAVSSSGNEVQSNKEEHRQDFDELQKLKEEVRILRKENRALQRKALEAEKGRLIAEGLLLNHQNRPSYMNDVIDASSRPNMESFGRRMSTGKTKAEGTIEMIRETIRTQEAREDELQDRYDSLIADAKSKYKEGSTDRAIREMKKAKVTKHEQNKIAAAIHTMETQIMTIEAALNNAKMVAAITAGTNTMKNLNSDVAVEEIDKLMEDVQLGSDYLTKINDILSQPAENLVMDEQELLTELISLPVPKKKRAWHERLLPRRARLREQGSQQEQNDGPATGEE